MATAPGTGPTDRRDAEAALAAREAELALWADRFRHDLLTPLAVISGMAETLEAAWDRLSPTDRATMLASIRTQATQATTLLDEGLAHVRAARPDDREII